MKAAQESIAVEKQGQRDHHCHVEYEREARAHQRANGERGKPVRGEIGIERSRDVRHRAGPEEQGEDHAAEEIPEEEEDHDDCRHQGDLAVPLAGDRAEDRGPSQRLARLAPAADFVEADDHERPEKREAEGDRDRHPEPPRLGRNPNEEEPARETPPKSRPKAGAVRKSRHPAARAVRRSAAFAGFGSGRDAGGRAAASSLGMAMSLSIRE
jgi:hypothetical protein